MKMNLGLFQVIVCHIENASENLNESLDFLSKEKISYAKCLTGSSSSFFCHSIRSLKIG